MVGFELTPKQKELQRRAREFAKKDLGGIDMNWLECGIMLEELAVGYAGFALDVLQGMWKLPKVLHEIGTSELSKKFLQNFCKNPRYLFVAALVEPEGGGSDNTLPYLDPKGELKLKAVRKGNCGEQDPFRIYEKEGI